MMQRRYWNRTVELADRADIRSLQWQRVQVVSATAYAHSPMYRALWQAQGVAPGDLRSLDEFRERAPTVTKADFLRDQMADPPYGTRLTMAPDRRGQVYVTSGTSGKGQEVHVASGTDLESSARALAYQLRWAGIESGDRMLVTLPVGLQSGGLSTRRACESYHLLSYFVGQYDSRTKLDVMRRFDPHAIIITPSYLTRLHAVAHEQGFIPERDFPSLGRIFLCAEPYDLDWAVRSEEYWGAGITEWYGCTQAGEGHMIACEEGVHRDGGTRRGILHNLEHRVLVEILDPDTGEPVQPYEEGEVVITNLHRSLLVIRFKTNDRARYLPETDCSCGRPFPGIEAGTVGRYDDMLKIRGLNVWPDAVDRVVFGCPQVVDYRGRVFVDDHGQEQVQIAVESSDTSSEWATDLERALKLEVGVSMAVVTVERGTLPQRAFKSRRWIDDRRETRRAEFDLQPTTHT